MKFLLGAIALVATTAYGDAFTQQQESRRQQQWAEHAAQSRQFWSDHAARGAAAESSRQHTQMLYQQQDQHREQVRQLQRMETETRIQEIKADLNAPFERF